jgi:Cu/Ag efflux protein CusF
MRHVICKKGAWWLAGVACVAVAAAPPLLSETARPAQAQASEMFGTGEAATASMKATVKAVDVKARTVTLVGPQGVTTTIKVGPQVQNLAQIKPGDVVVAEYSESVAYVLAPPGTKIPEDSLAAAGVRAKPGETPAGAIASRLVVTGLVVGVNTAANTLSLVNPEGGEVITVAVKDQENQKMLLSVKVGDTITAVISEAIGVAVEPAK